MEKITELFKRFIKGYFGDSVKNSETYELIMDWSMQLSRSIKKNVCAVKKTSRFEEIFYAVTKPTKDNFLIVRFLVRNDCIYYSFQRVKIYGGLRNLLETDVSVFLEPLAESFISILLNDNRFRLPLITGTLTFKHV